jgi:chitodextrinase
MHTAALRWQPPVDPGTGALAYYRILRDGADIGWTAQSAVTVNGLASATSYVFTVVAYNGAGLASPPSSPLTVTTASPPANTGPPPAATALLATSPASPIALGQSFTVNGSGWPCPGVIVEVHLAGRAVAVGTVDGEGRFTAPVAVEPVDGSTAKVKTLDGQPDVMLRRGESRLEARPAGPLACGNAPSAIRIIFS